MFTFILSVIIGWFIYEKFFRVNYKTGDEYLKELNTLTYYAIIPENPQVKIMPMWGYNAEDNLKYYADPSDILGVKPSENAHKIIGKNGTYLVIFSDVQNEFTTLYNTVQTDCTHQVYRGYDYVKYIPNTCPICGNEIWYMGPRHPNTGSEINTSIVPSSESRYCEHCRKILKRDTETLIPFYIEEIAEHPKLITVDNPSFHYYMTDCKHITIMRQELKRVGYSELSKEYDRVLSLSTLTEYSKNIGGIEQWELFKGLK